MYEIEVYQDAKGRSPLKEWIDALDRAASSDKNSGIQLRQLLYQIERLRVSGPHVSTGIAKQIEGKIGEIRPGKNWVVFAVWMGNQILLLHDFRKTTSKTPRGEIEKAKRELQDGITRHSRGESK